MTCRVLLAGLMMLTWEGNDPEAVRLAVSLDERAPYVEAVRDGVTLGIEEAEHAAALLGRRLEFVWETEMSTEGVQASGMVVAPVSAESLRRLASLGTGRAVVAIVDRNASVPSVFVVAHRPSVHMTAHQPTPGPGCGSPTVVAWHATFERYGAGQLNERFERRHARPMTGASWAGWVAVKALVEAALRAPSADGPAIAETLRGLRFDGHKGRALFFDEARQLVHPFYRLTRCTGRLSVEEVNPKPEP